jgi:hypothetical protein
VYLISRIIDAFEPAKQNRWYGLRGSYLNSLTPEHAQVLGSTIIRCGKMIDVLGNHWPEGAITKQLCTKKLFAIAEALGEAY